MIKCPNCGTSLKEGTKFCTKCGTTITEAVETTGNASDKVATKPNNEKMDSFKKNSLNYFQWFKNTIKHPSEVEQDNQYFGLVSFLINALLIAYSFYILGNKILTMVITGMQDSMGILGYEESTPKMDIPTGISLYLKLFFVVLAYFLIFILIGFLAKKYFIDEKNQPL
jgi:Predicted membrane protein